MLTELGEARSAELSDERNERFKAVFEPLSHEEKEQLLILLDKLTAPGQKKEPENVSVQSELTSQIQESAVVRAI